MKRWAVKWLCVAVVTFLIPFCLKNAVPPATEPAPAAPSAPAKEPDADETVRLYRSGSGKTVEMPLRTYLIGVVAAEMPVSFAHDALCAQALASLTYTLYQQRHPKQELAEEAQLSDDPASYQAYWDEEEMRERWDDDYDENLARICRAVDEVIGYEIVYEDEPVAAAFHAISPGRTESAENVWGADMPYLVSVESEGDSVSAKYRSSLTINAKELKAKLALETEEDPEDWFGEPDYSEAGTLLSVTVAGQSFTGQELRQLLGLQSAAFTVTCEGDCFTFDVKGYGHGVGMSQYGADYYARQGMTWREIIAHYYPGTTIRER
ncbi:MAG: stage II sporulation protein D [Clostridia bacterium]|nr:stage II sporulation protein D [Clostridia bacterium]